MMKSQKSRFSYYLFDHYSAVIVMIVQPAERNIFDQRWIEYQLFER
jgi:glutathione synthase